MKFKVILTRAELETLIVLMQQVFHHEKRSRTDTQSLLVTCIMQRLYLRMASAGLSYKKAYRFSLPMEEALAFQLYWTGKSAEGIFDSMLVNKIIGEIQRVTTNYLTINNLQ